jgi:oxygen-dependent protoporphyrinogen oxidase
VSTWIEMVEREPGRARVVVVGGGITGLTAAYRLVRSANGQPMEVTLLEASDHLGGKLLTVELDGLLLEGGADSFVVRKPWAVDLCKELGLGSELIVPASRGAYVWLGGRLIPYPERSAFGIPASSGEILRWPGLSISGRLRAATEFLHRIRRSDADESIGSLISRRMGPEAARVLVGPLLAGLHAGDLDRLSVRATFPELVTWEQGHESLIRGSRLAVKAARKRSVASTTTMEAGRVVERDAIFATVWGGLSRLVDTLEHAIDPSRIRLGAPVASLQRSDHGYIVETGAESLEADAVLLTTPAFETARLLSPLNDEAARLLAPIPYVSTAVVALVYPPDTGERLPEGTGFVVPPGDGLVTACTWVSRKWPPQQEDDRAVLRCFVGRAGEERALQMGDEELVEKVRLETEAAVPLDAAPDASRVIRWTRSMPQYEVGHLDRVSKLEECLGATPGVFVAGSAYRGIGIADCVRQAGEAAARVRDFMHSRATRRPAQAVGSDASEREVG